jgi:hypothetical protein
VLVRARIQDDIFADELAHAADDEYDESVWRRPGRSYRQRGRRERLRRNGKTLVVRFR